MIFSARPGPDHDAMLLRSVRQSLNTPVVVISELPVGPASAAIAIHDDAQAGPAHLTLAVRSERTRGVVFFGTREAAESTGPSHAAEAILSLAEGMGFLFDEDWVEAEVSAAGSDAERVWGAFASGAHSSPSPRMPTTATMRPARSSPEGLLTKFRRALPWNSQPLGRSIQGSAPLAAAQFCAADEFKELE
jgi:hypothetical protein